ncbi:MAG: hypothetical protein ABWZ58_08095 [Acidimicrobiia bacterium]
MGASRVHASGILKPITVVVMTLGLVACNQAEGTARGVVTSVDGSLEDVTSFVVLVEGSELEFLPTADGDYDFPLSHLREHQRTGEPVLVGWEIVGSVRYALSLADG